MRKIRIENWKSLVDGKEIEENIVVVLKVLVSSQKPEDMPKGLEGFRLFNRLSKAFDDAEDNEYLILEEREYEYLKKLVESSVPPQWGFNKNITNAIESFLNVKEE